MDSDEYKKLCSQPNAFSRHGLEFAQRNLRENNLPISSRIFEILKKSPIPKPEEHKGDKFTDYFLLNLSRFEVEIIVDVFAVLEAMSIENSVETSLPTFYGEIVDKWMKYLSTFEGKT